MKSALHRRFGHPPEVLEAADSPLPQPGPGEVRIRMRLAPIHNHELWTVRGHYGYKPELPAIGGTEACGDVDALGDGVAGFVPGQRVAVVGVHGTWAEYFLAPARSLVPLPDGIPDEIAAQLVAMPLSALMLLESLALLPGQWIMQNAANGAVGKTLALIAKTRGIEVVNLVRSPAGVAEMEELGLPHVVATQDEGWKKAVRALTAGAPIVAAIDSIGGSASGDLLSLLGDGGTLVSFGSMSGEAMQVSSGDLIFKQATIKGFWASRIGSINGKSRTELIGELIRLALDGTLKLPVEATCALDDIKVAAEAALAGGRRGKILLKP
ncbi:zinc-binding dehydrogenase [Xanthomonadaceae bacterium JHOS43]|nr:zinc-binding dehydrogenase [Xanthomonadaceae bacterium JHOS43]